MSPTKPTICLKATETTKPKIRKGRGGRPQKAEEEKRTIKQETYLSPKEHIRLLSMYNTSNFNNLNDFIRAMIFDNSVKLYFEDKNREKIIFQLSKIGGNINQISRSMNKMKHTYNSVSDKEFKVLEDIKHLLSTINI